MARVHLVKGTKARRRRGRRRKHQTSTHGIFVDWLGWAWHGLGHDCMGTALWRITSHSMGLEREGGHFLIPSFRPCASPISEGARQLNFIAIYLSIHPSAYLSAHVASVST